jgi:hypothetical protein
MAPTVEALRMYGATSDLPLLEWDATRAQLAVAGTYWVVAASSGMPHPRPVWGVLGDDDVLALSIGTPMTLRRLALDPRVSVHLDSGVDVVIVEGRVRGADDATERAAIRAYDSKYDWSYDVEQYGRLTLLVPDVVVAWRSEGWAGRDGFAAGARYRFL